MPHLVPWCDNLFDDDAVGQDEDFSDGREEQACSFHHPCPITEHSDTFVQLGRQSWSYICQLGYGITWEREEKVVTANVDLYYVEKIAMRFSQMRAVGFSEMEERECSLC